MKCEALPLALLPGPEPGPVVGRFVLELEADDLLVETCRRRDVVDDQDKLGEAEAAHIRCASYMPNSSRRAFEISPMVARARGARAVASPQRDPGGTGRPALQRRW